jgi:chemotaxis protein methyltransferase CheR
VANVIGGASMSKFYEEETIGWRNAEVAVAMLKKEGIHIQKEDVGGSSTQDIQEYYFKGLCIDMNKEIEEILNHLNEKRGFDFSGNRPSMIERRIRNRLTAVKSTSFHEYVNYLEKHTEELDNLIDVLTINVSRFFRETLTFEFIADRVLPAIVLKKTGSPDYSLRVWSAGCSTGEEPYSVAILINELIKKEKLKLNLNIFATDIDEATLKKTQDGVYPFESIKGIKYGLLKKYFTIR